MNISYIYCISVSPSNCNLLFEGESDRIKNHSDVFVWWRCLGLQCHCLCCLITRTSLVSTRWNQHGAVDHSQAQGFGHGTFSVSSQSLCLCKNSSEPFTPRLLPAGRIKIHTHTAWERALGQRWLSPGIKRLRHRDKRLDYKPSTLCHKICTCLHSIWVLWNQMCLLWNAYW